MNDSRSRCFSSVGARRRILLAAAAVVLLSAGRAVALRAHEVAAITSMMPAPAARELLRLSPGAAAALQGQETSPAAYVQQAAATGSRTDPAPNPGPWGPDAVWHGPMYIPCPGGYSAGPACLAAAMRNGGATPQAIAFAEAMDFQAYLREFRNYGRVDVGTLLYPFLVNDNEQFVLLNGTPEVVDVGRVAQKVDLRANPELASLLAQDPRVGLSDIPPDFVAEQPRPGGGQRFLFRIAVNRCHACQDRARPELAYDFNAEGRFLGAEIVDAGIVAAPRPAGSCRFTTPEGATQTPGGASKPFDLVMTNHGQWCSLDIRTWSHGAGPFGAPMHLLHRPIHGQVAIIRERYATRVEYRADQGFVGRDIFSVVNDVLGTVRLFYVSVTR